MRINVPRGDLARLLQNVTKVVESRSTIPIISCVRLVNADGVLTATATDLDIEARGSVASDLASEDAAFCVNARMLTDTVARLAGDTVGIAVEPGHIVVTAGRSRIKLQTLPVGDFPEFSADDLGEPFKVDMAALFAPCQFAISTEETRYYLNGVYFRGSGKQLTAVSTDGHRLAHHVADHDAQFDGIIVPRKISGLLPKGEITVEISRAKIRLSSGDLILTSKLIDGTFPDYERVIPRGNDKVVIVDRDTLAAAATRVGVVADMHGRAVKLSIAPDQIELTLRGDGDEATEEVSADYSGEPFEIGFNVKYLAEVLGNLPAGNVEMALEPGGPALMRPVGGGAFEAVLMPMRV